MRIHIDNTHSVGLGDHLCLISMLCSSKEPAELLTNNAWNTYDRLREYMRVLCVPESKLKLVLTESNGTFPVIGWPLKLFSSYYHPEQLSFGPVESPSYKKHCIGLVCYTTNQMYMDDDYNYIEWENNQPVKKGINDTFPDCKLRPVSYYAKLFEYIKKNRYDVITIDSMDTNFEEKVEMMTKYCTAIVGYEGGIAHLSHMLKIPFFMLDWRHPSPSTVLGDLHCELVHMTKYCHFLRSDDEMFSWSADQLDYNINLVRTNHGNNRLLNGEMYVDSHSAYSSELLIKNLSDNSLVLNTPSMFNKPELKDMLNSINKQF